MTKKKKPWRNAEHGDLWAVKETYGFQEYGMIVVTRSAMRKNGTLKRKRYFQRIDSDIYSNYELMPLNCEFIETARLVWRDACYLDDTPKAVNNGNVPSPHEIKLFLESNVKMDSRMFSVLDHLTYEIQDWIARGFDK